MSSSARIAVIDDEQSLRDLLELTLGQAGFDVRSAIDGAQGLTLVRDWDPDCIVLDVMMPKIDGLSVVPLIRRISEKPILMLTARGDARDRVEGLKAGADDYLAKPFDLEELVERVRAALRRPHLAQVTMLRFEDLEIDLDARTLRRAERYIPLTTREFDLLVTLARRPRRVFTREELLDLVWGSEHNVTIGTVETYISYLRTKIDTPQLTPLIRTIRGVGYALRES
jgi:DNA-binding response OmpR family regulator